MHTLGKLLLCLMILQLPLAGLHLQFLRSQVAQNTTCEEIVENEVVDCATVPGRRQVRRHGCQAMALPIALTVHYTAPSQGRLPILFSVNHRWPSGLLAPLRC
ncbi:MAG: hypothetical protein R3C53_23205 [Pirellulaceae bacterium]